jgi:hypothetical protein
MTDEPEKQRDKDKSQEVRFTASPQMWKYLNWLSRHTLLGKNEHEVAKQVLTDKLTAMRGEEYRDPKDV